MSNINWDSKIEDDRKIIEIAELYNKERVEIGLDTVNPIYTTMDLTACHLNGNPLNLELLKTCDSFSRAHDIVGISNSLCRDTGTLQHGFTPWCSESHRNLQKKGNSTC